MRKDRTARERDTHCAKLSPLGVALTPKPDDWLPPLPNPAAHESIGVGWKARLLIGKRGGVLGVVANALVALRFAPEWQGVLHFNESSLCTTAKLVPPFETRSAVPFTWTDENDVQAAAWLQHQGISVSKEIAGQAVQVVARERPFHPVRDFLNSLEWDGLKRIDDWLTLYLGVEPSAYVRAVGAKFLIGAVARVYKPGAKNDSCLILEGPQGALKSTALRTLAGDDFFSDDIADLGSKDSVLQTRGVWIIELSELDSMSKGEVSRVKAFMSRQVDRVRPPYGRRVVEATRECVFAGTTNSDTYLKDETGGRRFWPVVVGEILIAELRRDRCQIWAEARERFRQGENWWLDSKALIAAAAVEQQARYEGDVWQDRIAKWAAAKESVSITETLEQCLDKPKKDWTRADEMRISRILKSTGWIRRRGSADDDGHRPYRYYRCPNLDEQSQPPE